MPEKLLSINTTTQACTSPPMTVPLHLHSSSESALIKLRLELILIHRHTIGICADPTQLLANVLLDVTVCLAAPPLLLLILPFPRQFLLVPECVATVADGRAASPATATGDAPVKVRSVSSSVGRAVDGVVADGAGGGGAAEPARGARGFGTSDGGLASKVATREWSVPGSRRTERDLPSEK